MLIDTFSSSTASLISVLFVESQMLIFALYDIFPGPKSLIVLGIFMDVVLLFIAIGQPQ